MKLNVICIKMHKFKKKLKIGTFDVFYVFKESDFFFDRSTFPAYCRTRLPRILGSCI